VGTDAPSTIADPQVPASIIHSPEVREHLEKLRVLRERQMGLPRPALRSRPCPPAKPVKQYQGTKISTTLRISPDVLAAFRATGRGWQTRMDEALRRVINMQDFG